MDLGTASRTEILSNMCGFLIYMCIQEMSYGAFEGLKFGKYQRDVCLLMHLSMKQARSIHDPLCMDLVVAADRRQYGMLAPRQIHRDLSLLVIC